MRGRASGSVDPATAHERDGEAQRVVTVAVARLRSKIGAEHIVTVRGAGYKLART